jgi:hypothetical protein
MSMGGSLHGIATVCAILSSIASVACRTGADPNAPILLFDGRGTSADDVAALRRVLESERLDYSTVGSSEVRRMTASQLRQHRLLIVPGGNFEQMGRSLTPNAAANIRSAIGDGLNYLGICAGAFFAGNSPYNGLNLTSGVRFGFYAAEARGIRKAAVPIAFAGGQTVEHYWEDGPQLAGWGAVIGKYPDGTPAMVEGSFGAAWVVLTGVHPEAPERWRRGMKFVTPAAVANAYTATLIHAALGRMPLSHY